MTVFGISMVRDEADIIEPTLKHMATQVDRLIVADNNSTDGTRDLLADLAHTLPLTVLDDPELGYYQSKKMTAIAHRAGDQGATWVVPFDADEWWYTRFHDRIADLLGPLAPQWLTASAELYDHVATAKDDDHPDPTRRIVWRRPDPAPLPKVACRYRPDLVIQQGNHGADYDGGTTAFASHLVIRHFPYRSGEQFVRKARNGAEAYAATDLADDVGAHWRQYGQIAAQSGDQVLIDEVFRKWFWSADPAEDGLVRDPVHAL